MSTPVKILQGSTVSKNVPPEDVKETKIVLNGTFKGEVASVPISSDVLSKHSLFIGGIGSGKTTLFYHFVSQLKKTMTANDIMIIFDSKGDFHEKFYSKQDLLIGNSKQYREHSQYWNIFKEILSDGKDESDYIINTHEICRSFFEERVNNNSSNAFFPNAARDLLASIIIAHIETAKRDVSYASNYFYNDSLIRDLQQSTVKDLIEWLECFVDLASVASYIQGDNGQSQGVVSEMYSVIRELFIGVFSGRGTFSIRNFVKNRGGKILFIEYDLTIGQTLTPIYRVLIDLVLKEALGRGGNRGNVYIICDEFKLLPHLQHIEDGVNFGRSLGVKVFAGLQSIEQLYEIYGQSRGRNIAAGFSSVYAFHANDESTRNYVSGLFGRNIVLEQYYSIDNKVVEEKRIGNTVEDWNIASLEVGEAIVGLPLVPPFRFKFDDYR
jgi:type IV secretory pathway TraG/TraD family ATPase VirD4